jgi:pimeloyl-ACP methyl ester carboxylesterase
MIRAIMQVVAVAPLPLVSLTMSCLAASPQITVTEARIGCLDIQPPGNLTKLVAQACDNKAACAYKAPTEDAYRRAGVAAETRSFCSQAMEIEYTCSGSSQQKKITVPGDAWNQPPAQLACPVPNLPSGSGVTVTEARIGCLDIQTTGNLTEMVGRACNNRASCSFKAPSETEYRSAGIDAKTRTACTQAMEIRFHCDHNDDQVIVVPGDAWTRPPAQLVCDGRTVATNHQNVDPWPGTAMCTPQALQERPYYYFAPANMLDWTPNQSKGDYTFLGFRPPQSATRKMYASPPNSGIEGTPGSTLGANEGRVRAELRAVARTANPIASLCAAAKSFTSNRPGTADDPSGAEFGNAFADLSVTGKLTFERFVALHPDEATLRAAPDCAGATPASMTAALNRAYAVAAALRGPHTAPARQALGWIAVSGEDDQPYRPVNVPSFTTDYPQFQMPVVVPGFVAVGGLAKVPSITVNTRYVIAHAHPPVFQRPAQPLVDGGPGRQVPADVLPALAPDAQVLLFIHGMDSKVEESDDLATSLHRLGEKNWTVLAMDLPTSGYADNIDHQRISSIEAVQCHSTPLLDFIEEYIVAFVDTLDAQLHGQLKPRLRAVVGGSLGGNMTMRLGRRAGVPWITNVVPWSPAAIWTSYVARTGVMAGCDTGWDFGKDQATHQPLVWAGKGGDGERFLPDHETPELRRELFYGGFDWDEGDLVAVLSPENHKPQAQCWYSSDWPCRTALILGSRIDRQETYDARFRVWHWRLGAEQLIFSQQQYAPGTQTPLYLLNTKRMLLLGGMDDVCADLNKNTMEVAPHMTNTPGMARFLDRTGHSLDNEHPDWVAREIAAFLQ